MRKKHSLIDTDTSESETNPMDGLSNLADVMLVLAVGIMLALIINWNVDISTPMTKEQVKQSVDTTDALEFSKDQLQQMSGDDEISDQDLTQLGSVYYDEKSGKYYIVKQ
ncbi:MAG: DUF2149 domain-containing protein [Anaerovoracaceae bacterium]